MGTLLCLSEIAPSIIAYEENLRKAKGKQVIPVRSRIIYIFWMKNGVQDDIIALGGGAPLFYPNLARKRKNGGFD